MSALGDMLSQKGKRGRLVKGSQEAKDRMAVIRSMRVLKTWDPTKRALKPGTMFNKLVAFGPMKAPKKTPKPRAKKSPPAPIRDAATIAALIARANFRPRTKPRGRPRKDAKVFY